MTDKMNRVVWAEIPVTDLVAGADYFAAVLQAKVEMVDMGPDKTAVISYDGTPASSAHLYVGKPAAAGTGPTIHLATPDDLNAVMERVTANGGTVVSPVIDIPVGQFCYSTDPDGHSIGLYKVALS